jgi:putative ABC transport system permease protein
VALASRDFAHEWPTSLCAILALAAVLAPLLVLFGLRSGIVSTLSQRLRDDPVNREIAVRGNRALDPAWLETLSTRPEVGFLVARTRTLNATLSLETPSGRQLLDVDLIPTGPGDPLLAAGATAPTGLGEVLLTATAAGKLGSSPGESLTGLVSREIGDERQGVRIPLRVIGIVPEDALGLDAVLAPLALLVATEDYRDGYRVPDLGVQDGTLASERQRRFAGMRLYARSIDDVAPLAAHLREQGLDVVTRSGEIEMVRAIDRVLTFVFVVLAALGSAGFLLSLASSSWANVDRKRREVALLRLLGLATGPVVGFPATQALLIACGGIALSCLLYLGVSASFNERFASELRRDELVCRLEAGDAAMAAALTLGLSLIASLAGGYRASRIDPSESLREL